MATTTATANAASDSNNVTNDGRKPLVKDLHEHIVCPLCRGYLIDATTLVECLHSFCRGCIVRRLGSGARACPVCGELTLPPLLPDLALQRLVYMAVPGLYRSELERRRHFRMVNPQCPPPAPPLGALSLTIEDAVSLSLCEILDEDEEPRDHVLTGLTDDLETTTNTSTKKNNNQVQLSRTRGGPEELPQDDENRSSSSKRLVRYLKCPAGVTVRHLVRLLALKRGWGDTDGKFTLKHIEMLYQSNTDDLQTDADYGKAKNDRLHRLQLSWTLLDLACIFKWDKETPMKLFYRVVKRDEPKLLQPPPVITYNAIGTGNNNNNNNNSNNNNNNNNNSSSMVTGNSTNNGMENVQRPPTPPPSPKQSSNSEIRTQPHQTTAAAASKPKSKSDEPTQASLQPAVAGSQKEADNDVNLVEESSSSGIKTEKSSSASNNQTKGVIGTESQLANIDAQNTSNSERENYNGVKVKKPRCEVTPVMRAPGFHGSCTPPVSGLVVDQSNGKGKVPRIEHHKRRKRRNKRLIAEITTTPREDLLKLKVRLTPCPPRITSSTGGSAKEKLLQMRAVRREKIKSNNDRVQTPPPVHPTVAVKEIIGDSNSPEMPLTPPPSASAEVVTPLPIIPPSKTEGETLTSKITKIKDAKVVAGPDMPEETIEDIIDGIPDEVVRVAQNLHASNSGPGDQDKVKQQLEPRGTKNELQVEVKSAGIGGRKKRIAAVPEVQIISDEDEFDDFEEPEDEDEPGRVELAKRQPTTVNNKPHKKDEEVLRRLGLVAISEASKTLQDKIRGSQKSGGSGGAGIDYNRESLERQLRESKANRVRSLLAEKQMRDALKSIMSKSKGGGGGGRGASTNGPKKGPPPLAPLTPKQGFPNPPKTSHPQTTTTARVSVVGGTGKIEKPLDLSSGANNALDLSPATPSSSVTNPPVITSTTFTSPVAKSRVKLTCGGGGNGGGSPAAGGVPGDGNKVNKFSGDLQEKKNTNQDNLNLRTLSDAAVSLLGSNTATTCNQSNAVGSAAAAATAGEVRINNNSSSSSSSSSSTILSNKVALRIPQYHNRISSFGNGVKIKPNSAVRYIPNPQAFVASQYVRNQRTNFFNAQQQPP